MGIARTRPAAVLAAGMLLLIMTGCEGPWNSPYPPEDSEKNILYSSFEERPKHLDPIRAYSSNEYSVIANIYEPPLQYHFLKRPYTLVPLTATAVPVPYFLDSHGRQLPADAEPEQIATSIYDITIQPGIMYQPHPALAVDGNGRFLYHDLQPGDLRGIYILSDFEQTGTRELTAADYVYQIKRLAHPDINSPIFGVMSRYIEDLAGYSRRLDTARKELDKSGENKWLDLRKHDFVGVTVLDRYTYRVRIKGKYPQFKYWLAMPFFAPMPWEADLFHAQQGMNEKNLTLNWYPIGSGPYMLTENNPNLRMVMERNPNFHGEAYPSIGMPGDAEAGMLDDAGRPMPFIDKVIESLEKESIPRWNKFLQGYYDVSGLGSDTFDQAIQVAGGGQMQLTDDMAAKGIRLSTSVATATYYFGFNMLDPVVGSPAGERGRYLRQAIAIAVDYEEFISIFLNGRGVTAQDPIPPGIFGYEEGEQGVNPVTHVWRRDKAVRRPIEDAKRLMARAGYPGGRDETSGEVLKLYYDTVAQGPDSKAQLNWWRKQFAKLGIELIVRPTDYNRFQDKMIKGRAQLFSWGWNADYPDPENFFFLLYGPNGKFKHHGENAANYDNPVFNRLFEKMKNMENNPERLGIIRKMIKVLRNDSPWLWGIHPRHFALYHEWYFNSKPNLMANNTLKYKRIDPQRRKVLREQWNRPVLWPVFTLLFLLIISVIPAVVTYRRRLAARPELIEDST